MSPYELINIIGIFTIGIDSFTDVLLDRLPLFYYSYLEFNLRLPGHVCIIKLNHNQLLGYLPASILKGLDFREIVNSRVAPQCD